MHTLILHMLAAMWSAGPGRNMWRTSERRVNIKGQILSKLGILFLTHYEFFLLKE